MIMASPFTDETSPTGPKYELQRYRPHIQILDAETEKQRFPRNGDISAPNIAVWRCNLAALSQRRNLLFTAHESDIYVWTPTGPHQLPGAQPEMVIHPVMKEANAAGYINPSKPHSINNIIVDDLGLDEVLLLATDSGNVTGYNVEAIFSAINRAAKYGHSRPFDSHEVRPFFAESVQMSAWGLATHKFARLIAVSANTGTITVFAFALVDRESDNDATTSMSPETLNLGDDDGSESTWVSIDHAELMEELKKQIPHHRTRNLRLSYNGHFTNIPCVSFANFELDPNGLWMVSTDICNRVFIWRVWEFLVPLRTFTYDDPQSGRDERGWFVLPIHPRRVQHHRLKIDACGTEPLPRIINNRLVFDVSKAAAFLTTKSTLAPRQNAATPGIVLPDHIFSSDEEIDSGSLHPFSSSERGISDQEAPQTEPFAGAFDNTGIDTRSHHNADVITPNSPVCVRSGVTNLIDETNEHDPVWIYPQLDPPRKCSPSHPVNPQFFPILHFSGNDITLDPYPMDRPGLQTVSRSPFRALTRDLLYESCDRINMVTYLTESGIVVAATQTGAVAIITLTWQEEVGHSFRVDWIVPFFTQREDSNTLDTSPPLMGLAAGPMPGFEVPSDVPCIPRDVDPSDWLEFNWRLLNPDKDEPDDAAPPNSTDPSMKSKPGNKNHTLSELHAHASSIYRPRESWHGYCPSRHYRLLLIFCDNSVMSYEFWHDWRA